ncbi:helix-turn-helix transcriptional regulator [Virgibacillus sp. C22-A2]|uniref:Helix-turn-helix transcriptional regulator n=1 Tax=Virgibacillus tibetensis TaxID=3042313 RepID=A0ABU6KJJ0_9BACI|nr:helix-turn-helix transcriptional regulator [Virgibacillus sp. C22-A2]
MDEQFRQLIGQFLREYRQEMSFTIERLAEEIGISTNHLGRIERGESDTTLTTYIKMAVILEIPSTFHDKIIQLYKNHQV